MGNLELGVATISVCSIITILSWRQFFQRGNYTLALFLLLACGLLLRLYVGSDFFLHDWDERYHALVAKNLIKHPLIPTLYDIPVLPFDYKDWSSNHIWIHKQPIPLWFMAFSMHLFGVNELALRLPSILLSTIAIALTYKIGHSLFTRKVGYIAAFLHCINGLIIELTGGRVATDHIDLFFLFFIELAVFFAVLHIQREKNWRFLIFMSISIGIAVLCKWLPALIVFPIWFFLGGFFKQESFGRSITYVSVSLGITLAVILPWQFYIYQQFPLEAAWERAYNVKHIFEGLGGHGGPFYYHLNQIRIIFGELIYIPLLWWFWISVKKIWKKKEGLWLAISCWILLPLFFFSLVKTKMQGYIIFTAPAVFIVVAVFWQYLSLTKRKLSNPKVRVLFSIIAFLLLFLPIRYSVERIKPFSNRERTPEWAKELKTLNTIFPKDTKVVLFNTPRPIETMFYTDNIIAYPFTPNTEELESVIRQGYDAYRIDKNGKVKLLVEVD